MAKNKMKYEDALERIETIVSNFEQSELTLDELSPKLKEAKELLAFCKDKLIKTEEEVNQLLNNGKK